MEDVKSRKMAKGGKISNKVENLRQGKLPVMPPQAPAGAPTMPVAPHTPPVLPQRPQIPNRFRGVRAMSEGGEAGPDDTSIKIALQSLQRRLTNLEGGM